MTTTTPQLSEPLDPEQPDAWIDMRIQLQTGFPEEFAGKSYRELTLFEEGRIFLAKRTTAPVESDDHDPFAAKALYLCPHHAECTCAACKITRKPEPVQAQEDEKRYFPDKVCSECGFIQFYTPSGLTCDNGHGSCDSLLPDEWEMLKGSPPPATPEFVAQRDRPKAPDTPAPPADTKSRRTRKKKGDQAPPTATTVSIPKASKANEEQGDADLEAAKRFQAFETPLGAALRGAEEEEDAVFVTEAEACGDPIIAGMRAKRVLDERIAKLKGDIKIDRPEIAVAAAKQLIEARDALKRAKREAETIVRRAERAKRVREEVLAQQLEDYVKTIPKDKWATDKTIRFEGWVGRITFCAQKAGTEITDHKAVVKDVIAALGLDGAIERGLIEYREEVRQGGLTAWTLATGQVFEGTEFSPEGDGMVLYKR